jgi:hypothetical protein
MNRRNLLYVHPDVEHGEGRLDAPAVLAVGDHDKPGDESDAAEASSWSPRLALTCATMATLIVYSTASCDSNSIIIIVLLIRQKERTSLYLL